ncbi:hypothetical protein J4573_44555 [Actinomadura barringtoniae]|uniref:Uncharacterized protein n=1 Tax=Actinomadura barringtoniae TaxID=1427535 RepID=A0A939T9G1_9ACTN|nr:hypothetical protein [Actinomadura barringtoniae]MBO2454224.1 hypothetical protein [Actinomadura barringtoniae]
MSDTEIGGAGAAEFAGATLLLLRRYAAGVPSAQQNDLDRAVGKALDKMPGAKDGAARMVRAADKLSDADKRARFGGNYAFKPSSTQVLSADLGRIVDGFGGTATSKPPKTVTHKYDLQFSHMICDDVSNPEWLGKDEPYTTFALITQKEADDGDPARSVVTPVYKVKEGDRAPASGSEQLRLFGRGGPAAFDSDLLLTAAHFEHDLGDKAQIASDIASVLTAAAAVATAMKKPLAAVVLGALSSIAGVIATIGADDAVGNPTSLLLNQADADSDTAKSAQVTLPALRFDGGDPNGIYRVFLTLRRAS